MRPAASRELFVRHARKDGQSIVFMRALDFGDHCEVEALVSQPGAATPSPVGPYRFPSSAQANAFVVEAVEALTYLGCDVTSS
jgi:hypothetical protein